MTRLVLVRHGRTDWNEQGRFQGQRDVALNEAGRREVRLLAARLAREAIQAVYASDLGRAWETAALAAEAHGLAVCPEPRLREMGFGAWEGLTYAEIEARFPRELAAWQDDPVNTPPGGEGLAALAARVEALTADVAAAHAGQTVLLVGHGGALQVLLCRAFGLEPRRYWQFRLDPASLSVLYRYEQGPILALLNDTGHLAGGSG